MEGSRPSFRYGGCERRLEVVSGKSVSPNPINISSTTTPSRPDSLFSDVLPAQSLPPRVTRLGQGSAAPASKPWGFSDGEMKRRKRIAKYKVYTVEGRVKGSIRNGLRWFKNKCSEIVHGY